MCTHPLGEGESEKERGGERREDGWGGKGGRVMREEGREIRERKRQPVIKSEDKTCMLYMCIE